MYLWENNRIFNNQLWLIVDIDAILTISWTLHPLDKSWTGFESPHNNGPKAWYPAKYWVILYAIFAAPKSGNIKIFAVPLNS